LAYNDSNAPGVGNIADGCVQLSADQPSAIRIGRGVEPAGVLPSRRKASLRDDGKRIGIAVRSLAAGCQMPFLPGGLGDSK